MARTKKTNNTEKKGLSMFEETLMWTSYRYCIGRHTYVTDMAYDMANHYYDKLSDEKLAFTAMDIRSEIADSLRFAPFHIDIDWSIDRYDRKPLEFLFNYMIENNFHSEDDFANIDRIEVYKDRDSDDPDKIRYRTVTIEPAPKRYISEMDITDLIPWMDLASFFDKKNYKIATIKYNGKEEDIEVFETYKQATIPLEDKPGYCKIDSWRWEKRYIGVNHFKENARNAGYIVPEYIIKVVDKSKDNNGK